MRTTFRFTGQRSEEDGIGLYYYGARWYDSYLNRWTSPDPIIPDAYNPLAYDRYSYVYNNPVRYTDPSGHCIWDLCIVEGIGLIELALVVGGAATAAYLAHPDAREAVTSGIADMFDLASQGVNSTVERLRSLAKASGPKPLTPDEQKHADKLTKGIDDFLAGHPDLPEEAEQVAEGEALPEGADHVREAKDFARGLERSIEHLQSVRDKRTTEAQKVIDQAIEHAQRQLEYLRKLLGDW
jgi:RHS repeat-associated protein